MQVPFFDITRQNQLLKEEFQQLLSGFLDKGQTILGDEVTQFEEEYAAYIGTGYCISCANATDALEMLLEIYRIGPGDEVIVPGFGWISLASAVLRVGATPVFVDVGSDGNIDVTKIELAITKKTKAIIAIHLYGNPCNIEELRRIRLQYPIKLIEDAAQAHGAEVNGKKVGSFGDASVFSFYPTKNLGALGDAGAILTNDLRVAEEVKSLRDYGRIDRKKFAVQGRNSRMDELQAGILRLKLRYLDGWNNKRQAIVSQYEEVLNQYFQSCDSVYYKHIMRVKDRIKVISILENAGIATDIYYPFQLNQVEFLQPNQRQLKNSKALSEEVLSLPLFPELSNDEIGYICEQLPQIEKYIV